MESSLAVNLVPMEAAKSPFEDPVKTALKKLGCSDARANRLLDGIQIGEIDQNNSPEENANVILEKYLIRTSAGI